MSVMGLLLLGVTFFLAIILISLSLHDELSPKTIAAANSGWTLVNTLMVASVAGAAGAIGLGIWGEVPACQRRGTRGRWVGIVLGCVTLLAWAWPWLRR